MPSALDHLNALIAFPSVTPDDAGCFAYIRQVLQEAGYTVWQQTFQAEGTAAVGNLFARIGTAAPHVCLAGHIDVVPVGDESAWNTPPFTPVEKDGLLYGRGASDMKGAVAAFLETALRFAANRRHEHGSLSLLLTADEEGPSINGTKPMLAWMHQRGETPDYCLVGEPTNPDSLGDMLKIGRRGSLNGALTIHGRQGHVAYPHLADNPNHTLVQAVSALLAEALDDGNDHFPPSSLQITSLDVGNTTTNIIPATASARFNIRFNNIHSEASLTAWLHRKLQAVTSGYSLDTVCSGEAFLTPPGALSDALSAAVQKVTGRTPSLSTTGGTSDARFIVHYCPVIEFGGVNASIHQVNEHCRTTDIPILAEIYSAFVDNLLEQRP